MFCSIANFYNTILSFMLFLKHNIEYSTINFDFSFQHPPIRIFSNRKPNFYSRYQIPPQERIVHPRVRKRKPRKTRRERNASSSLLVFFFFSPDYALNYCRFGLNLGLIITKPSECADVTIRVTRAGTSLETTGGDRIKSRHITCKRGL